MRAGRFIEHLPPWAALGALLATGAFAPWELALMALPLAAAALLAPLRLDLTRWRRPLEILALLGVLGAVMMHLGLVTTVLFTLFLVAGLRLLLPPSATARRQILLASFLALLATAIASFGPSFLAGLLAWALAAAALLLQQTWEEAQGPRRVARPPFRHLAPWFLAAFGLGALCFLALPRIHAGMGRLPWGMAGRSALQAGLSDRVDLGFGGPIRPGNGVVLRIRPEAATDPASRAALEARLALLPALRLERLAEQRWEPDVRTPARPFRPLDEGAPALLHLQVAPSPDGLLALPYGGLALRTGARLRPGPGGSLRWAWLPRGPQTVALAFPAPAAAEPAPTHPRRERLLETGRGTGAALRWSLATAPESLPAPDLCARLASGLQAFRYTLDNPSGRADNPLEDFLERSRAGHCEYFASALAVMLRHRGVPARVVNGYRLGPWIPEGGYWVVTENEAHSWVEFWDDAAEAWRVADPTPGAPPSLFEGSGPLAALRRWRDALAERWDRRVLRYSLEDQLGALAWLQELGNRAQLRLPVLPTLAAAGLLAAGLLALRFRFRARRRTERQGLALLRPLLKRAAAHPPLPGESLRTWLRRLAALRPERRKPLDDLAARAEAVLYGGAPPGDLAERARREARAWRTR